MTKIWQTIRRYDLPAFLAAVCASAIGMVFIYSATKNHHGSVKYILVQGGALVLGLVLMYFITAVEYEDIAAFWPFIAGFNMVLLILVLIIGGGRSETGTQGWIRFAGIGIQPAEIAKIAFIITLSKHLSHIEGDVNYFKNVIFLLLHLCVPVGMVMLQPDAGTAMVYAFIFIVLLFIAGIDWRYIAAGAGAFALFGLIAWNFLLTDIQIKRFYAFLNPESDPLHSGYHVIQSKIAVGSGQITGKGLFQGIQTQLDYLFAKQTDFIYAVIGEEAGMIGCIVVLLLLAFLITRAVFVAQGARTRLGTYLCTGVAAMWMFHTVENIGMTVGLVPVTGIPLPFVSYGGSSMVTNFMALGLVLGVRMRKKTINF